MNNNEYDIKIKIIVENLQSVHQSPLLLKFDGGTKKDVKREVSKKICGLRIRI